MQILGYNFFLFFGKVITNWWLASISLLRKKSQDWVKCKIALLTGYYLWDCVGRFSRKKEIDPVINTPANSPMNEEPTIIPVVDVQSVGKEVQNYSKKLHWLYLKFWNKYLFRCKYLRSLIQSCFAFSMYNIYIVYRHVALFLKVADLSKESWQAKIKKKEKTLFSKILKKYKSSSTC